MSRVWKLDRKQYNDQGLLPLYRGDDWNLYGTVVDRVNGYETLVDMSQYSVTGFFPAQPQDCCCNPCTVPAPSGCGPIAVPGVTGACGMLSVKVGDQVTPNALLNSGGTGAYVVLADALGNLQTVPTIDQAIVIIDRGMEPC